jgi:hypothetical protein
MEEFEPSQNWQPEETDLEILALTDALRSSRTIEFTLFVEMIRLKKMLDAAAWN